MSVLPWRRVALGAIACHNRRQRSMASRTPTSSAHGRRRRARARRARRARRRRRARHERDRPPDRRQRQHRLAPARDARRRRLRRPVDERPLSARHPARRSSATPSLDRLDLRELARPHLERSSRATGETATLSVPGEHEAVTVDFVRSPSSVQSVAQLGRPSVAHATAAGKVMLAFGGVDCPPAPLRRYTARTIADPRALARELERVRAAGLGRRRRASARTTSPRSLRRSAEAAASSPRSSASRAPRRASTRRRASRGARAAARRGRRALGSPWLVARRGTQVSD